MRAWLTAGVLGGLGLWGAASVMPTGHGVQVGLACWVAATVAAVGVARLMLSRSRPSIRPAGAWVVGSAAAAIAAGWPLCPTRADYEQSGPVLAIWIFAGTLALLSLGRDPAPLGLRGVPARALVGWGLAYGAMWCLISIVLLPAVQSLPDSLRLVVILLVVALGASTLAGSAFVGPSEPVAQGGALMLSQTAFTMTVPDLGQTLVRVLFEGLTRSEDLWLLFPILGVAGSGWGIGAVAIWLRARHLARSRT